MAPLYPDPYYNKVCYKGTVLQVLTMNPWVPNKVKFLQSFFRCSTREDEDELMFATSKDFQQDKHTFSGSSRGQWSSFQVPGE